VTSLFGRAFRKERPLQPARLSAPQLSPEWRARAEAREDMPPRPVRQPYRSLGPDTTPKLAFGLGPVDPEFDPCGTPHPPLKTGGDETGGAP
jgi:hypothetical protein